MTRRWLLLVGASMAAMLAIGALFWFVLLPPLPGGQNVSARDDTLVLPPNRPDSAEAARILTAQPLWGREVTAAGSTSTDIPWRFVGAVGVRGSDKPPARGEPFILIAIGDKEPEIRRIGDALPGGAVITRIRHDQICVRIEGRERSLSLSSS